MKKTIIFSFGLVLAVLIFIPACKKDDNPINPIVIPDYQNELQNLLDDNWAEFAEGKENFPGGYALQILSPAGDYFVSAGDLKNISNKTHFRAASTTKTFTGAAIVLLHQHQKLNINDLVTNLIPGTENPYLPNTEEFEIPYKEQITIKMLLQHRAGMFDIINQNIPDSIIQPYAGMRYCDYVTEVLEQPLHTFTIKEMANIVAINQLYNSAPEVEFHYSDTGMGLLGLIIERVSGKRYDQFITDNFLIPLGLTNTSFPYEGNEIALPEPFAESYFYSQGEQMTIPEHNVSMHVAEGNVITTPENLSKWMKKLYTGDAGIDYQYVRYLMMDCLPTYESHQYYGLGTVFTPTLGYGHNGGHKAFFTAARYDPETDITFVIFINVWDFDTFAFDMYTEIYNMYGVVNEAKKILKK